MGHIIEINDHLDIELRRESFRIYDDELPTESPEFGYERVFPLEHAIAEVKKHPRFVEWLREKEGRR